MIQRASSVPKSTLIYRITSTLAIACFAVVLFATSGQADTYLEWKQRVFSETEQADPTISSELAFSPAGDGIPNLVKYAFAIDPHQNGSLQLPQVGFAEIADP